MATKVKLFKNGAYVSFERNAFYGQWLIKAYNPAGALLDKVITFDVGIAFENRTAVNALAKNA